MFTQTWLDEKLEQVVQTALPISETVTLEDVASMYAYAKALEIFGYKAKTAEEIYAELWTKTDDS